VKGHYYVISGEGKAPHPLTVMAYFVTDIQHCVLPFTRPGRAQR
jgi:hypothetical protein